MELFLELFYECKKRHDKVEWKIEILQCRVRIINLNWSGNVIPMCPEVLRKYLKYSRIILLMLLSKLYNNGWLVFLKNKNNPSELGF